MRRLYDIKGRLGFAAVLFLLLSPAVRAEPVCAMIDAFARELSERYQETASTQGVSSNGRLVRLFVSPAGSWTILIVLPEGRACIGAHGDGWAPAPGRAPEPARDKGVPS